MYSAEAFIKCTNDKIKRMEASVNHLEDSSKKLAQHNKQLKKQLGVRHSNHFGAREQSNIQNKAQAELTEVDFNHLKVQNELFIADIEAKNNEFTNLKVRVTLIWSPYTYFLLGTISKYRTCIKKA